jgi:hypothetical protein
MSKTPNKTTEAPAAKPGTPHGGREMEGIEENGNTQKADLVGVGLGVGVDVEGGVRVGA